MAISRLLVWVPPPPQVTLQGVHVLQVSQIQSKGFASEIKKTMARLKLVTIMRISQIQSKGLHTAYLDQNNFSIQGLEISILVVLDSFNFQVKSKMCNLIEVILIRYAV